MSTLQTFGKGALRVAKNYTKGYTDVQAKVREATSNDPWGPSGTQMNEIAQMTYNPNDFIEVMEILDKRLNDKGKNWRHVFKALTLVDYCLHAGSENTVAYFRENIYLIKTLREFQHVDEFSKDQGANVRHKAKDITNLLQDESRLRAERKSRAFMRDRDSRLSADFSTFGGANENDSRRSRSTPPGSNSGSRKRTRDEGDLRRAIEESRKSLVLEQERQARMTDEERDLAKAIKLSEEEEAARNNNLLEANARSLFDDQAQQNNPFQMFSTNLMPQHTIQPQFTSFNPYAEQMRQRQMEEEYLRQQAEYAALQQQQQLQQRHMQEEWARQQQQEEWMRQQQLLQQQQQPLFGQQQQPFFQPQIQPQPTGFGSNNPFAFNRATSPASPMSPPLPALSGSVSPSSGTPEPPSPMSANTRANARRPYEDRNSHLAQLIRNREDGMDTFGNTGQLRMGHHYTGPQLVGQRTGTNPFAQLQQTKTGQPNHNEQPFFTLEQ